MPRFAANLTMMFTEHAFLDRFAAAAEAGFEIVEFQFPYDHPAEAVADAARASGLGVALLNLPPGDWQAGERGLAALPGREADFAAALDRALDYAGTIGVGRMHVMAGIVPPDDARARATYRENLALAAERAAAAGRQIVIEPINPRDMPGYFLNDFGAAAATIAAVGHPALRLMFDIYHRQIIHGDVLRGLEALMPLIGHVQIASVPDRAEPGSGELRDDFILAALDRLGYRGVVGLEYRPAAGTREGLAWRDAFRAAGAGGGT
jgi:hydroxypyruvate isomerase